MIEIRTVLYCNGSSLLALQKFGVYFWKTLAFSCFFGAQIGRKPEFVCRTALQKLWCSSELRAEKS